MTLRPVSIRVVITPIFAALLFASGHAHAQAWVPDQNTLELAVDYNFARSDEVISTKNLTLKNAGTDTHQVTFGASFVPLEHLALDVSVPLESLKYTGDKTMYVHPG